MAAADSQLDHICGERASCSGRTGCAVDLALGIVCNASSPICLRFPFSPVWRNASMSGLCSVVEQLHETYFLFSWEDNSHRPIVKNLFSFYGTRRCITVIARACHWSICWATWVHSSSLHSVFKISFNVILQSTCRFYMRPLFLRFSTESLRISFFPPCVLHVPIWWS